MTKITIGSVQGNVTIIRCKSSVVRAPVTALHGGYSPIHPPHCPRRCLCLALLVLLLTAAQLMGVLAGAACVAAVAPASAWPAPSVPLQPVQSSAIAAMGYDSATQQLYIVFTSSAHPYTFCSVPAAVFDAFMAAPSPGQFYNTHIRARYGCTGYVHFQ